MADVNSKRKPKSRRKVANFARFNVEICILAGGQSKRMGSDKARLRLGQTTMLGLVRKTARATGLPVRVIRRDCIPKCGPLGGIHTALKTTRADAVLFLACDMPLVSTELLQFILRRFAGPGRNKKRAIFTRSRGVGFPFILRRETLDELQQQIGNRELSIQSLATALEGAALRLTRRLSRELFNVNTLSDWAIAVERLRSPGRIA